MTVLKIDHVGIAVRDAEQAIQLYTGTLGLTAGHSETIQEQGVRVTSVPLGESQLEFLEPLDDVGPVGRFLAKRGEGIHHICIQVEDIREAMVRLAESGAHLLSEEPTLGAGGSLVAFVHPRSASGVLLELSQPADEHSDA